jgi:uncharacterized Tic20 family protein
VSAIVILLTAQLNHFYSETEQIIKRTTMHSEHLSLIRQKAMWLHASGFFCTTIGCIAPIISLLIPYLYAHSSQGEDPLIAETGRNVTNYHLSIALYSTIMSLIFGVILIVFSNDWAQSILANDDLSSRQRFGAQLVTASFCAVAVLTLTQILSGIFCSFQGIRRAREGYVYRYPLTIDFLKAPQTNP